METIVYIKQRLHLDITPWVYNKSKVHLGLTVSHHFNSSRISSLNFSNWRNRTSSIFQECNKKLSLTWSFEQLAIKEPDDATRKNFNDVISHTKALPMALSTPMCLQTTHQCWNTRLNRGVINVGTFCSWLKLNNLQNICTYFMLNQWMMYHKHQQTSCTILLKKIGSAAYMYLQKHLNLPEFGSVYISLHSINQEMYT